MNCESLEYLSVCSILKGEWEAEEEIAICSWCLQSHTWMGIAEKYGRESQFNWQAKKIKFHPRSLRRPDFHSVRKNRKRREETFLGLSKMEGGELKQASQSI